MSSPHSALVPVFAALGDPTRLSLMIKLSGGGRRGRSIASLAAGSGLTRQAVTKHLRQLQLAGLVDEARVGRERRFTLRPVELVAAGEFLDGVSAQWDAALERLRVRLEQANVLDMF